MSVIYIQAKFECDGCGNNFTVNIDPADSIGKNETAFDLAEDWLRGNLAVSIQCGMHLCEKCTRIADNIKPDDDIYQPSRDEILEAIEEA